MRKRKYTARIQQVQSQYNTAKQVDLQQRTQEMVVNAAHAAQRLIDEKAKELTRPIVDAVDKLKDITARLNKLVDTSHLIDGIPNPMGAALDYTKFMAKDTAQSAMNAATDAIKKQFEATVLPEDSPILQDIAGKLLSQGIKTGFETIKPPASFLESIAPIAPLAQPITAIIDALNAVIEIASINISDKELNAMLARKCAAAQVIKAKAEQLANLDPKKVKTEIKGAVKDKVAELTEGAENVAKNIENSIGEVSAGLENGLSQAWRDFKTPELPPGIETTIKDFIESIKHVCANIQNVAIVILFMLIGAIFDALNQIVGVIGVPTFPHPLDKIMKLIPDIITIFMFVMQLPTSLIKLIKAIIKKKIKQIAIMMDPPPLTPPIIIEEEVEPHPCGGGGGGGGGNANKKSKSYNVMFYAAGDIKPKPMPTIDQQPNENIYIIDKQQVIEGESAKEPTQDKYKKWLDRYEFVKWEKSFDNIQGKTMIPGIFKLKSVDSNIETDIDTEVYDLVNDKNNTNNAQDYNESDDAEQELANLLSKTNSLLSKQMELLNNAGINTDNISQFNNINSDVSLNSNSSSNSNSSNTDDMKCKVCNTEHEYSENIKQLISDDSDTNTKTNFEVDVQQLKAN